MGASAGGNLAAAVTLKLFKKYKFKAQILLSPALERASVTKRYDELLTKD